MAEAVLSTVLSAVFRASRRYTFSESDIESVDTQTQLAEDDTCTVPWCEAARQGEIEMFNGYQESEIESLRTPYKNTVLHVYLASHDLSAGSFVEGILEKCPSLLLKTNAKGETPLHIAARNGHSGIVEFLINYYQEKATQNDGDALWDFLRKTDLELNTPLHMAVEYGHLQVVKALLMFEDPNFLYPANRNHETPLYLAARKRDHLLVAEIIDKFKSTAAQNSNPHDRTILHVAAMAGSAEATRTIIEKRGINLTKETDKDGRTALHYAAHLGYYSVVSELLEGDKSLANIADKKLEMTALLMAARQGHEDIVKKIMVDCPESCGKVDKRGWNLLHFVAIRRSPSELFDFLINGEGRAFGYTSIKYLRNKKNAKGITPRELYFASLPTRTIGLNSSIEINRTKEYIIGLLEDLVSEKVAEEPVCPIPNTWYDKTDEQARVNTELVVATLITTVTFAAAITVPGGFKSEGDSGTPFLIREKAFQAFVITNSLAFCFSLAALGIHFCDALPFLFGLPSKSKITSQLAGTYIAYALVAVILAFSTGSYAVLEPNRGLAISSCFIGILSVYLVFYRSTILD